VDSWVLKGNVGGGRERGREREKEGERGVRWAEKENESRTTVTSL